MEIFKRIMEIISKDGKVWDIKQDDEMRVASFFFPDNFHNSIVINPLIKNGLVPDDISVDKLEKQKKIPLEIVEGGKKIWKALLFIRNNNVMTLAVSSGKGQP